MLCSWARHLTSQCLSTRVFKRAPANLMLGWEQGGGRGGAPVEPCNGLTSHRGGSGGGVGCRNSSGLLGHKAPRQSV